MPRTNEGEQLLQLRRVELPPTVKAATAAAAAAAAIGFLPRNAMSYNPLSVQVGRPSFLIDALSVYILNGLFTCLSAVGMTRPTVGFNHLFGFVIAFATFDW